LTLLVDGMELNFTIDDANIKARISKITSPDVVDMNLQIGEAVKENVKIHVGKMSVPRHKTADRLGAGHSGFYENAVGRVILKEVSQDGAVVEI
jgi:hypothetical protein